MSEAKKHDVERSHSVDGITEYDNPLPRWWLMALLGTMVFGYAYWMYFHVVRAGLTGAEGYDADRKAELAAKELLGPQPLAEPGPGEAQAAVALTDDALLEASKDHSTLTLGKLVFAQNCAVCHGAEGEGKIGPNLTDEYWLHGGKPSEIYTTVSKGVLDKGMQSWLPVLGPEKTKAVVAYVVSRARLNLPGKAPQGERVTASR